MNTLYSEIVLADQCLAVREVWDASFIYIDWDGAAEALKMDYTTVEYQGNTYYARA